MKVIFLDIDGVLNTVVDSPKIWIRGRGFHFNIDFCIRLANVLLSKFYTHHNL